MLYYDFLSTTGNIIAQTTILSALVKQEQGTNKTLEAEHIHLEIRFFMQNKYIEQRTKDSRFFLKLSFDFLPFHVSSVFLIETLVKRTHNHNQMLVVFKYSIAMTNEKKFKNVVYCITFCNTALKSLLLRL